MRFLLFCLRISLFFCWMSVTFYQRLSFGKVFHCLVLLKMLPFATAVDTKKMHIYGFSKFYVVLRQLTIHIQLCTLMIRTNKPLSLNF